MKTFNLLFEGQSLLENLLSLNNFSLSWVSEALSDELVCARDGLVLEESVQFGLNDCQILDQLALERVDFLKLLQIFRVRVLDDHGFLLDLLQVYEGM